MDIQNIKNLIGIEWGKTDCLALSLCAHETLTGEKLPVKQAMNWNTENIEARSQEILQHIAEYADEVTEPRPGDVGIMRICGGVHLYTFVTENLILHIKRGGRSCLQQYTAPIKRRTIKFYRWR